MRWWVLQEERWPRSNKKEQVVFCRPSLELVLRRHCCCSYCCMGWLLLLTAWMALSVLWPSGIGLQAWSQWIVPQSCALLQRALLIPALYSWLQWESNSGWSRLNCLLSFPLTFILDQAFPPLSLFLLCLRLTLVQFFFCHPYFKGVCVCVCGGEEGSLSEKKRANTKALLSN